MRAGAVVALGLTLVSSVRRRRRYGQMMKTLGFTQRQLAKTVAWQASVTAIIGVVVGVPLGITLREVALDPLRFAIYAVPEPSIPGAEITLIVLGALVVANVVAAPRGGSQLELQRGWCCGQVSVSHLSGPADAKRLASVSGCRTSEDWSSRRPGTRRVQHCRGWIRGSVPQPKGPGVIWT